MLTASLVIACAMPVMAAPFVPQSGAQVVETLPRRADGQPRELLALRAQLRAAPNDAQLAASIARRYIAMGRSESDPRYYGYAQSALAPWWAASAPPPPIRLLRATLLQTDHQFDAALADLKALTQADPANAQAWLTLATVQAVRGDYQGATASCAHLSTLAVPLASFSCLAAARINMGPQAPTVRLLQAALQRDNGAEAPLRIWAQALLAEAAARSGSPQADQHFRQALADAPRDSYLLAAYADYLLDQNRAAEAETLLRPHRRIDSLLLRHALALKQQGRDASAANADRAELQARFNAAALRGDSIHLREQARFTLHLVGDTRSALDLARRNWQTQKELADLRLLLEAAAASRDAAAFADGAAWVRAHQLEDPAIARLLKRGI